MQPEISPEQSEILLTSSMMPSEQSSPNWCSEKEVDPFQISVQQLANFLIFLFEEKRLSPSTIKGYRSAISRTIHLSGGPDFGSDEFISLLVKNFSLELPRQRVLIPSWNLSGFVCFEISPF